MTAEGWIEPSIFLNYFEWYTASQSQCSTFFNHVFHSAVLCNCRISALFPKKSIFIFFHALIFRHLSIYYFWRMCCKVQLIICFWKLNIFIVWYTPDSAKQVSQFTLLRKKWWILNIICYKYILLRIISHFHRSRSLELDNLKCTKWIF